MRFRLRLIITISVLIALTFGIGGTALITTSFHEALHKETSSVLDEFEGLQNTLSLLNSLGAQSSYSGLCATLAELEERGMASWQAISLSDDAQILYSSGTAPLLMRSDAADSLTHAARKATATCVYWPVSDGSGHAIIACCLLSAGERLLTLTARFDITAIYDARQMQQRLFLAIYSAVVLLGIVTATVLSFAMTVRLKKLTDAVRRFALGDLDTRANLRSNDEFGQLSRSFDAMADKLQHNITQLQTDVQRRESFMGAFAHELKTPMTSIIGYADLLRQDDLDDTTRLLAAGYIFSEGQRLEKLSFKLLDLLLLQQDTMQMRPVNLYLFLREVEQALGPNLHSKKIQFVCKSDRGRAVFEPDLVKSLLYNLVDNASKAMDGEGVIALKATAIPGGCRFLVVDNGRGMEKEELSKITEAFYRVDKARSRSQGGAGLGLALCRQIVELHGGNLHFASTPGRGTRVTVTLYGNQKGGGSHA